MLERHPTEADENHDKSNKENEEETITKKNMSIIANYIQEVLKALLYKIKMKEFGIE